MKDKEKQIEEMAKEAFAHCNECQNGCEKCEQDREERPFCNYKCKAKYLIEQGWVKLPEDSIVNTPTTQCETYSQNDLVLISREEFERLSSSHDIVFCDNKDCPDNILCRCAEISECPKNIPEYNEKLLANKHKLELYQKLCKERERADSWKDRYKLLEEELKQAVKETAEKILKIIKSTNFTKEYLCELIIQIFGVEIKE